MINTKGEWIYTNAEIAYELGLSPATVNAIRDIIAETGYVKQDDEEVRKNVRRDLHNV